MEELIQAWIMGDETRRAKTERFIQVAIRDGGTRCAYCELDLLSYDSLYVLDHVIPRKPKKEDQARWLEVQCRFSIESMDNLVNACKDCNNLKGRYLPRGQTPSEKLQDARNWVERRRTTRTARSRPDLLQHLIRDARESPGDDGDRSPGGLSAQAH